MAKKRVPRDCADCGNPTSRSTVKFCSPGCRSANRASSLVQRFWNRVNKSGPTIKPEIGPCWIWLAGRYTADGYGAFHYRGRMRLAHRVSWELTYDRIPMGLQVLHKCDNPPCVRPDHLFTGTQADNIQDAYNKGRKIAPDVSGVLNGRSRLTEADVLAMRQSRLNGRTFQSIAEEFRVSYSAARDAVVGINWRHLKRTISH